MTSSEAFTLSADGVEVVIDLTTGAPVVVHWGDAVTFGGDASTFALLTSSPVPHATVDFPVNPGMLRERARGFHGRPALGGHRDRRDWSPLFGRPVVERDGNTLRIVTSDPAAGLEATTRFTLEPSGILLVDMSVTNVGDGDYQLEELTSWLPLPDRAVESLDFTGRWLKERQPQRRDIDVGTWLREGREGRPGHASTIVQCALTRGTGFGHGEAWAIGLLWSGNWRHAIEKNPDGRVAMGAGELLEPGELVLKPGESYSTPTVAAAYSASGLDGVTDRYHRWLRARPGHPTAVRPRPLTLNVWEAVYFDHDLPKLEALVEAAAEIGVERFVLDDGWFGSRRDDRSGLGDWAVSEEVWPEGLHPLVDRVVAAGMEFGLWFEGEMVNTDSTLYRAHPEWILHVDGRMPPTGRHQQVLDLGHQGAFDHVLNQVDALLHEYPIAYIKWDHNRTLIDPAHLGVAAAREQTLAIYRLFDELKRRHPGLEIESCASGGGRVDLGMALHADRFWTSDSNDALERLLNQRYTGMAIPPEMLGTHIGPTTSHSSGRTHALGFRALTALFGHAGLEWDITQASSEERAALANWAEYYKRWRDVLHSGRVTRVDHSDPAALVHGVVAQNRDRALFCYVQVSASAGSIPDSILIPGLDASSSYRVVTAQPAGVALTVQHADPLWVDGVTTSGAALARVGIRPPILMPEQAILIEVTRQ